jgi:acetyltransferase-like isoleucine patch superfamily enzyme
MKQNRLALIRDKYLKIKASLRKSYYGRLGMKVHNNVSLGRIKCNWPAKVLLGKNCTIEDDVTFKITHPFSPDNYIQIGDRVFIGSNCEINCASRIQIGNDCLIASSTTIVDSGHEIADKFSTIRKQPVTRKEIVIADDVWIGARCVIIAGVTIGKGSVIGAGSIVNKSIPEYQVWAGCPARFIKNR